jgi:site-specific recombinase XerD
MEGPPSWLQTFLDRLAADDLSAATRRGYRYDLLQFITWYIGLNSASPELARLTKHDLIACLSEQARQSGGRMDVDLLREMNNGLVRDAFGVIGNRTMPAFVLPDPAEA